MSDLRELYQQVILDHNKSPRNFREMADANRESEGFNPLCGDHINLYVRMDGDRIDDISFKGSGCAISKASASLMTSLLKGKTREEAESLFGKFREMITGDVNNPLDTESLGKLAVFSGVCEYPARVKCAILSWHALIAALEGKDDTSVSTE